jgi:hypothetical protein
MDVRKGREPLGNKNPVFHFSFPFLSYQCASHWPVPIGRCIIKELPWGRLWKSDSQGAKLSGEGWNIDLGGQMEVIQHSVLGFWTSCYRLWRILCEEFFWVLPAKTFFYRFYSSQPLYFKKAFELLHPMLSCHLPNTGEMVRNCTMRNSHLLSNNHIFGKVGGNYSWWLPCLHVIFRNGIISRTAWTVWTMRMRFWYQWDHMTSVCSSAGECGVRWANTGKAVEVTWMPMLNSGSRRQRGAACLGLRHRDHLSRTSPCSSTVNCLCDVGSLYSSWVLVCTSVKGGYLTKFHSLTDTKLL